MSQTKYNENHKQTLDKILLQYPEVKAGKMFGFPAYYVGGKLFACIYENGVGLKVSESRANELREQSHIDYFQPLGRKKMREWVQIDRENSEDYLKDKEILFEALEYVAGIAGIQLDSKQN
jgi:TfoX/Sxy family transcriptional regulator of competence genes